MSTSIPELPLTKKHRIDHDKALNRVTENASYYHETGVNSRAYQIVNSNEVKKIYMFNLIQ